ncbi:hypothetical protein NUW58_g3886 [Xylaria curta]|uniref:Uncharacterized protein n=1 Tax=Xylaria curta TaxID=42375 RepID=A0ACC1PAC5_9PEZI|nr:hypothetical protein NUW58_g3886 [Xylaria curta]
MLNSLLASSLYCLLLGTTAQAKYIVPGARWRDTEGNLVNAHAGNVVFDKGTFWLFGEHKTEGQEEGGGISVYSSPDLATWQPHGLALEPIEGHPYISPSMIIQRPKVVYSEAAGQYHMLWHADNSTYGLLLQGLATSPSIAGPYNFVNATAPLGNWSQDFGLFTDYKDGRSYALYSNGDRREGRDVYLTSYNKEVSDLDKVVHRFDKYDLEAPTIIQTEKSYYALMSHKTGYRPNNVVAFRADNLGGPWSQPWVVAPLNTRTFNSQSGFTLRIKGKKKTTYLYLGDQWDSNSLWESRYIWLPMNLDDKKKTLSLEWHDVYDLDVKSGNWSPIKGKTYLGKHASTSGSAFKQEANFASEGTILTGIYGNDSTVTFHGIEGTGKPQWVSFYYQNTDDMGFGDQPGGSPDRIGGKWQLRRISSVIVNGDTNNVETLYQRDTHKGIILSTPLQLTLKKGRENTITVGGLWNGFDYKAADLDKIIPTVFFSPGAFHPPTVFDSVRSILSDRGFETEALMLVSFGSTDPSIGMLSDAKHLRSLLTKLVDEGKEVIFVAHSYGGVVISNAVEGLSVKQRAAEGKKGGVLMILYLCAFFMPAGTSLLAHLEPKEIPWTNDGNGFIEAEGPLWRFYQDVEPTLAQKSVESLRHMSAKVMEEESTYEPWNEGFNVGYVFTEFDNTIPIEKQKTVFSLLPEDTFSVTLASGHSPFLSMPSTVADIIQNALDYAIEKKASA